MARKRILRKSSFKSWDDVNEALRKIAELQSGVDAAVAAYNEEEASKRKMLDEFCNPRRGQIKDLEDDMSLFAESHREEFGKKKSKELANGSVGFRVGMPQAKTLRGFTWKSVLQLIKNSRFNSKYMRIREAVDKEQIIQDKQTGEITEDALRKLGMEVVQLETFGYEINIASDISEVS